MKAHYELMLKDTEKRVFRALQIQNMNEESKDFGGIAEESSGIYQAKSTIYKLTAMVAVYQNPKSEYYRDEKLFAHMQMALFYIERSQHENGLFDYVTCNFFSSPDTAFCIKKLIPTYELLKQIEEKTMQEAELCSRIEEIIRKGAEGILLGGFHTPNHRWAIASVLAKAGTLFSEKRFTEACFAYLNEGIDCNADGEFSEKSAGNYNRINNDAMILLSQCLQDSAYEQYAVKNLKMMLTYFEPNDSIFTANSTRFDKDHLIFPKDYYLEYLQLGIKYQITEFLDMANEIFDIVKRNQISSPDFLTQMMLNPEWIAYEHDGKGFAADYEKWYQESGIVRIRRGDYSVTLLNGKSNFLYFQNRSMKLEMKLAGSFCEHRAFVSRELTKIEGGYRLHQIMKGWYYLPFQEKQETSDWWKMDHEKRAKVTGPDLEIEVKIFEKEQGIDVELSVAGVEGAPWRVELAFSGIDRIENEHISIPVPGSETIVLKDSCFEAINSRDRMTIGPAFGNHHFTDGKEDSETKTPGCATVYFTDVTAFHHTIMVRNGRI